MKENPTAIDLEVHPSRDGSGSPRGEGLVSVASSIQRPLLPYTLDC